MDLLEGSSGNCDLNVCDEMDRFLELARNLYQADGEMKQLLDEIQLEVQKIRDEVFSAEKVHELEARLAQYILLPGNLLEQDHPLRGVHGGLLALSQGLFVFKTF
ncbi:MAG: hypothetical protein PHU71_02700 [Candidatus Gracilibacteria bacterium]|nr:hypothetical protein [Candidatus Gracilibacteria bacterium]